MTTDLSTYTLPQLKHLSARITKEIAKQESAGKSSILKKLKKMAREHGLTLDEVLNGTGEIRSQKGFASIPSVAVKAPLPVKYRHPSKQDLAWSGRGRKPQWVEAWLSNGGALDALATAAQKFEKKQQKASAISAKPQSTPPRESENIPPADVAATAE